MIKAQSFLFLTVCGMVTLVSIVSFGTSSFAEQRLGQPSITLEALPSPNNVNVQFNQPAFPNSKYLMDPGDVRISQKLNKLRIELKNAKSTEQKEQTKKSVREALVEYFDADMKQREAELDRLKARSEKMSAALKKREAAKEQLVDLQLKSFQYEAEGLGLFSKPSNQSRRAFESVPSYVTVPIYGYSASKTDKKPGPLKVAMNAVNKARQNVRSATSDEDRTKATTELRNALSKYFDVDLKARQQEMDTINAGLEKMQAGLQKRADAKDDIVNLQLQIIVNEAEGLGFFRKSASRTLHGADNPIRIELGGFGTSTGYLFR